MKNVHRYGKNQRGIALFLTLISLALLSVIGFGLISLTTAHSRAILVSQDSNKAYYLARVGIARAIDELEHNYFWLVGDSDGQTFDMGDAGKYTVKVTLDPALYTSTKKVWKVESTGEYRGAKRKVTAWLQMESFAVFCYFTDAEKMGYYTIWFIDKDHLDGRVHTNGYFSIYKTPHFTDKVTSHNNGDYYFNRTTGRYSWRNPPDRYDPKYRYHCYYNYNRDKPVWDDGDYKFAGGQPDIPLPVDTGEIKDKAQAKYKSDIKVTFHDNGTVTIKYKKGGKWKTDTLNTDNLTIHTTKNVYFEGSNSVLNGKVTIAADKNVYIKDNVQYKDDNKDVLGIVAGRDVIVYTSPWVNKDLYIDATIMALNGSFYVYRHNYGRPRGTIHLFGGLIQYRRGPVGTFSSGGVRTGYDKDYRYDKKLLNNPPPNYPTTGNIILLALEDSAAFGH